MPRKDRFKPRRQCMGMAKDKALKGEELRCRLNSTVFLEDGSHYCKLHAPKDALEQSRPENVRNQINSTKFLAMLKHHALYKRMLRVLDAIDKTSGVISHRKLAEARELLTDLKRV